MGKMAHFGEKLAGYKDIDKYWQIFVQSFSPGRTPQSPSLTLSMLIYLFRFNYLPQQTLHILNIVYFCEAGDL